MNEQQNIWFEQLVKIRTHLADALDLSAATGVQDTVVEKYSDQAHFIYELLQNADDAKASKAEFILTNDGLCFKHNGTIHFSISEPDTMENKGVENRDKRKGILGHVNSICSIGNSSKKTESNSIGKFGVGFKAVFQYTKTPHIYDPSFQFKIERFIIPKKLENDWENRQKEETVFFFPFNKPEMSSLKAHSEILEKLKKLIYPTLFLFNLKEVKWTAANTTGQYSKKLEGKKNQSNDIFYEKIELSQQIGLEQTKENLYLFNRVTQDNLSYSVGFFLDDKNSLSPKRLSAFCFFPTKETTGLNFIIHAPFLLNDSREGIKRFESHNTEMCNLLSHLAADSLLILRDLNLINDDIIKIIPYKKLDDDFFNPFYDYINEKFQNEVILPTVDNYTNSQNAYWAQDNPVLNLFSDQQLSMLIDEEDAKWVFRSFARNQTGKDEDLRDYIENCIFDWYEVGELFRSINADFIENQPKEWLYKLYEYILDKPSYWSDVKIKPIFINAEGKAVAAFDKMGKDYHEILFLPSENQKTPSKTIHPDFLQNEISRKFISAFGIKKPNLKDEIYNHILPLYEDDGEIDTETHFKMFFKYWIEGGRPEDFLELIRDKEFISYKTVNDNTTYRGRAKEIYFPNDDLLNYFETKGDTKFIDLDEYYGFITVEKDKETLKDFLLKLGVREQPRLLTRKIEDYKIINRIKSTSGKDLFEGSSGYRGQGTFDNIIDGCEEIINGIDSDKSLLLWNILRKINLSRLKGVHKYFYYTQHYQDFESTTVTLLKKSKWLLSINNQLVSPVEITVDELDKAYQLDPELESLLGFKPKVFLTKEERIASLFDSEDEAEEAQIALKEKREKEKRKAERENTRTNIIVDSDDIEGVIESLEYLSPSISKLEDNNSIELPVFNEDEELRKGIEELKKQLEIKKNRVVLAESINKGIKYSYDWFITYIKLLTTYGEKQSLQKSKSISFQEIKPYKQDNKYFLLRGSSTYISPEIENADDFKVSLVFKNGKREHITIEGVSKKGQDLLIYSPQPLPNNILAQITNIFKVEINFTPVIDLLDRLEKAFKNRNYINQWDNIEEAMPSLNYIYGPPGTGKTTTLCAKIAEILSSEPNAKFLVLTPTNKASDVVCKKLNENYPDVNAVRLSRPTDPELEQYQIYRDTLDYEEIHNIDVIATTIHRLPYFDIKEFGLLFQYDWDYVIFDESSMTGLHYITFAIMALFKSNSKANFIVAGDPKQIPPVVEIDEKELEVFDFQDENIYKMMNLESFNPSEQIIREKDSIVNLRTQYRSVPVIGQLFSELSYSRLLSHDRATNRKEAKPLPEKFRNLISSNVSFIDIPLSQDNSIYRVNKLFYSSYHTYCAILVSEIIKYFDFSNVDEEWTVGLIAPYKAQAMLLNKLITSYGISDNVKVVSDTVHGFQGDECDIVFFVCNPNNYFFTNHKKALLSKEYIYNVAISRAKDYLIVLHPYTAISNNTFINQIEHSYKNNFGNPKILNAHEIEYFLFKERNYIEDNSYVSGHDNVNVFGLSQMRYFIKSNDTAIDIQIGDIKVSEQQKKSNKSNQLSGVKIVGKIDLSNFEKRKK